jgi:hypothetical protein
MLSGEVVALRPLQLRLSDRVLPSANELRLRGAHVTKLPDRRESQAGLDHSIPLPANVLVYGVPRHVALSGQLCSGSRIVNVAPSGFLSTSRRKRSASASSRKRATGCPVGRVSSQRPV